MRVTTRLMQAASWLLVQRAVHEGDMDARGRVPASATGWARGKSAWATRAEGIGDMPAKLRRSSGAQRNLYRRIARLDDVLFGRTKIAPGVKSQFKKLEQAFGRAENGRR